MANLAITNTFVAGTSAQAGQANQNFTDVKTWLNNRDNASDFWLNMKVSASVANPAEIKSSNADCEFDIDSTGTNGTPRISWRRSGTGYHTLGVDGAGSNFLKFGTTALTTNVSMQIPTAGLQVQFADGSASSPSVSFINNTNMGMYRIGSDTLGFGVLGAEGFRMNSAGQILAGDGSASVPTVSFKNDITTGLFRIASAVLGITTNGVEVGRFDTSATASNTRFLVYDVTAAALVRVSRGASDSGGTGFRLLRIPN